MRLKTKQIDGSFLLMEKPHIFFGVNDNRYFDWKFNNGSVQNYKMDNSPSLTNSIALSSIFFNSDLNAIERYLSDKRNSLSVNLIDDNYFKQPKQYLLKSNYATNGAFNFSRKKIEPYTWSGEYDFNTAPNRTQLLDNDVLTLYTATAGDVTDLRSQFLDTEIGKPYQIQFADTDIYTNSGAIQSIPFIFKGSVGTTDIKLTFQMDYKYITAGLWNALTFDPAPFIQEITNAVVPDTWNMQKMEILYLEL